MATRWKTACALGLLFVPYLLACEVGAEKSRKGETQIADVIAAVIDAYGGEEALHTIVGYHVKGEQFAVQSHAKIHVEPITLPPNSINP